MQVELDVFSGRPNPRWQLGEDDRRALLALESGLTSASGGGPPVPGLGYRGFVYGDDLARRVYMGQVARGEHVLGDPAFAIERLLLATLPPQYEGLRPRIASLLELR